MDTSAHAPPCRLLIFLAGFFFFFFLNPLGLKDTLLFFSPSINITILFSEKSQGSLDK